MVNKNIMSNIHVCFYHRTFFNYRSWSYIEPYITKAPGLISAEEETKEDL